MNNKKGIQGFIFSAIAILAFSWSGLAANYYTIGDNQWSYSQNGPDCNCSPISSNGNGANQIANDSLFIAHAVTINKLKLNSFIRVLDGGSLTLVGNGFGSIVEKDGILEVNVGGEVNANTNFTVASNGDLIINGVLNLNSSSDINGGISGEGVIYVDNNNASVDSDINGTSTNDTWNNETIFLGTYDPSLSDVVWFVNGEWSSSTTDCSTELRVMSNCLINTNRVIGKLLVSDEIEVTVDSNSTFQVCQEIENFGFIFVRTGSTLEVLGQQ